MMSDNYSSKTHSFFEDVYEVAKLIPKGRVTSYGAIAKYLGKPNNSRMVGWAMNGAGKQHRVPAHRVVNSKGELSGAIYFGNKDEMANKLKQEGVEITKNKVKNFKFYFWDPTIQLL